MSAILISLLLESWAEGKSPSYFTRTTPLRGGAVDHAGVQWSTYGGKEGIWRLIRTLDLCHLRGSVFCNARSAELYPDAIKQIVKSGHLVEGHGLQDQYLLEMTPEVQKATIAKSLDILAEASGERPKGWVSSVYRGTSICSAGGWVDTRSAFVRRARRRGVPHGSGGGGDTGGARTRPCAMAVATAPRASSSARGKRTFSMTISHAASSDAAAAAHRTVCSRRSRIGAIGGVPSVATCSNACS